MLLKIHCSKGTYVRSIAEDLGEALGCGGHVIELRRLQAGPYSEADLVTIEQLEQAKEDGGLDDLLMPVASAVSQWPEVQLSANSTFYVRQGQPVQVAHAPTEGWVRLMDETGKDGGAFIGVGEIMDDGRVAPRRLVT